MKKHLSVFGLFARSSLHRVLLILFAMCAIEIIFFHIELKNTLEIYEAVGSEISSLERIFARAATNVYFRIGLISITFLLCLPGCQFKSRTGYTLCRLSISERATFFNQALYNILVYFMLFAVQLVVAFVLSQYYISMVPSDCISNQTVVLAFYRNEFLHSILPLEDIGLWIRNALLILSLGFATAEFPYTQRRHKFSPTAIALLPYTVVYFDQSIGNLFHVITTSIIALMIAGEVTYVLKRKDEEDATDEQAD